MFKSKECVGHMVGGAVVGVAVGMLVQKILSPRSAQQSANSADKTCPKSCENVKKCPRSKNLQVPSDHHKNRSHRHQCRSKSASRSKHVEKECSCLSVSRNSQQKSKLSASESDLRSSSTKKSDDSRKLEIITKPMKTDDKSDEYFLNTSTNYVPFDSKVQKNPCDKIEGDLNRYSRREPFAIMSTEYIPVKLKSKSKNAEPAALIFDINNRKSDSTSFETIDCGVNTACNTEDKALNSEAYRESIEKTSTEYLMPYEFKNVCKDTESALLVRASSSVDSLLDKETANCSINATCDTLDKEFDFDSYCENRKESIEESEGFDGQEFVTLPTFDESSHLASTE